MQVDIAKSARRRLREPVLQLHNFPVLTPLYQLQYSQQLIH